jgi:hypothetical protein
MMDPFLVANPTSSVNSSLDAAIPVGLLGEQKYIKSVRSAAAKSGKKFLLGFPFMYTTFSFSSNDEVNR